MSDKRTMFDNDATGCAPVILVVGVLVIVLKLIEMMPKIIEAIKGTN